MRGHVGSKAFPCSNACASVPSTSGRCSTQVQVEVGFPPSRPESGHQLGVLARRVRGAGSGGCKASSEEGRLAIKTSLASSASFRAVAGEETAQEVRARTSLATHRTGRGDRTLTTQPLRGNDVTLPKGFEQWLRTSPGENRGSVLWRVLAPRHAFESPTRTDGSSPVLSKWRDEFAGEAMTARLNRLASAMANKGRRCLRKRFTDAVVRIASRRNFSHSRKLDT